MNGISGRARPLLSGCAACGLLAFSTTGDALAQSDVAIPPVDVQVQRPQVAPRPARVARPTPQARPARSVVVRRTPRVPAPPVPVAVVPPPAASVAGPPPTPSTGTVGAPPAPYAGGQVATGAQLGLLGNRSVLDTPFNQTSYTAKTIQDQQARTVGDVLSNEPSVRVVSPPSSGVDVLFVRGFYYDSGNLALNGLYGIAPQYSTGASYVERVEVLKGPGVLLSGMPPAGASGGAINIVTKKAPDYDITQLTPFFVSNSQFGTAVDIARRAGDNKEFGLRFNGAYSNGDTPVDRQTNEYGSAVLGLDYRGDRARFSADFGYQAQQLDPPLRQLTFLPTLVPLPRAPSPNTNYMVPWATWQPQDTFAMGRGEVDVTDWATVYGAIGFHRSLIDFTYPSPTVINGTGDYQSRPFRGKSSFDSLAGEVGVRARFDTGPVNHLLTLNYSRLNQPNENTFFGGTVITSNIYSPRFVPRQFPNSLLQLNRITTDLESVGIADTFSFLGDRVQLTAGGRYQSVAVNTFNRLNSTNTGTDGSVWSPAFALLVRATDNISLYANYIEGLQPGTTVGAAFTNAGQVFAPFQTKQAEAGLKIDAGRFTTTVSFFQITQPSVITVPGLPTPSLRQDGEQRNTGAEINVFGELTPGFRLLGGVAFIDGRLTRTASNLNNGNRAPGVAPVNVNLGAELDIPYLPGLTLMGRAIYTGEQAANATNTQFLKEWTRVDLGARYTFASPWNGKPVVVRAFVENVANARYYAAAYNGVVTVGSPRTYYVSATLNF